MSEVIDDGISGVIVDTMDEAIGRIGALLALPRLQVRHQFERRFTARRMADDYLKVYRALVPARSRIVPDVKVHRSSSSVHAQAEHPAAE